MAVKRDDFEKRMLNGLSKISDKLIEHDARFEKLEFDLKDFMLTHFDKIYSKLEKLEQEYHLLSGTVKRLEEKIDKLEKIHKGDIELVKKQALNLLSRIEKLEARVGV